MVQELHIQDIAPVKTKTKLTPKQEELLWWEHYEKIRNSQTNQDGTLPIQERYK
jgi:hypothetical protein